MPRDRVWRRASVLRAWAAGDHWRAGERAWRRLKARAYQRPDAVDDDVPGNTGTAEDAGQPTLAEVVGRYRKEWRVARRAAARAVGTDDPVIVVGVNMIEVVDLVDSVVVDPVELVVAEPVVESVRSAEPVVLPPPDEPQDRPRSRYCGVSWDTAKRRWRATTSQRVDGKKIGVHIGYFADEDAAARAFDVWAMEMKGDTVNFPVESIP